MPLNAYVNVGIRSQGLSSCYGHTFVRNQLPDILQFLLTSSPTVRSIPLAMAL
jgi:hypothetical protein